MITGRQLDSRGLTAVDSETMGQMIGADRKRQIAEAALDLVGTEGVQSATNARIAAAAGITAAAVYRHFENRDEVLVAALDILYDRIRQLAPDPSVETDVLKRLRTIGLANANLIASDQGVIAQPLVEFAAAPRSSGLREICGARQLEMIRLTADTVEEGKAQGTIRPDVDSEQVAWEISAIAWAENIAYMMGLAQFVTAGRSTTLRNAILERIAVRPEDTFDPSEAEQIRKLLKLCPLVNSEANTPA